VVASLHVGSNVHVSQMVPAVRNTVGARKCARIASEVAIAQRVSVAAGSVHALLLTGNVILMCVETAG
jgi:hypothetical protein